ncbi:hypothetical protein FNF29_04204 [Cafeteria roenbergensis]|uniref:WW domain-containing protein n=1 Tax=Cafeteria roenbergensis TaxID=33653 RepID=A0A5A8CIY3_CAFRO|nr:hypothetical protein FNF29_04204 [Cafeteria roenbergensis]|eukprot:KAA0152090.1 hypothetical protein FNF29_04204 [Cafeteria roenbergensis]
MSQHTLGEGWGAVFEPTQSKYYYTQGTSTQWEWPEDDLPKPDTPAGDWTCHTHEGKAYYYNAKTQVTEWQPPPEVVDAWVAAQAAAPAASGASAAAVTESEHESPAEAAEAPPSAESAAADSAEVDAPADPAIEPAATVAPAAEAAAPAEAAGPAEAGDGEVAPQADAAASGAGEGTGLEAESAPDAAAADGTEPAPAAAASPLAGVKGAPAEVLALWKSLLGVLKEDADEIVTNRRKKFERLRKIRAKKSREEKVRLEREAAEAAEEEALIRAEELRLSQLTLMVMTKLDDPPPVERKYIADDISDFINLERKGNALSTMGIGRRSETTASKALSWKNEVLAMPLTHIPKSATELWASAIQCFRNITGFMGDRSSNKQAGGHAEKLLKMLSGSAAELRDEAYMQLMKQTTNNESDIDGSELRGWQLFTILTGSFPPSDDLLEYVNWYFKEGADKHSPRASEMEPPGIHEHAEACIARLAKLRTMAPRKEVAPTMEVEATKDLLPVMVRVYFLDGTFEMLPATSLTTATDMRNMLRELLGIEPVNMSGFGIFDIDSEGHERYLEPTERILDVVAYWLRLYGDLLQRDKKRVEEFLPNRFVFKVKQYYSLVHTPKHDSAAERLLYTQAVYDVVKDRYPCLDEDCVKLGAIQRQAEAPHTPISLEMAPRYLKEGICKNPKLSDFVAELNKQLADHAGKDPVSCMREYLKEVKSWKIYGSSFFWLEPVDRGTFGDKVFAAVNPRGVMFINPDTKENFKTIPYSELPQWGHAEKSFVIFEGSLIKQTKHQFTTRTVGVTAEMNDLIHGYVNEKVARQSTADDPVAAAAAASAAGLE